MGNPQSLVTSTVGMVAPLVVSVSSSPVKMALLIKGYVEAEQGKQLKDFSSD